MAHYKEFELYLRAVPGGNLPKVMMEVFYSKPIFILMVNAASDISRLVVSSKTKKPVTGPDLMQSWPSEILPAG